MTAVSQTAGPEMTLCGEAGLPYGLLGYVTDYANGVVDEATPVATLMRLLRESGATLADTLVAAVGRIDLDAIPPVGTQIAWDYAGDRADPGHTTDHGSRRRRRT